MCWILIIGTGPSHAPLIEAARRRGYSIIGVDRSPNTDLVDISIPISTYSTDKVIDELGKTNKYPKFEGVLCRSSGPAVETAATVAEKHSLPTAGLRVAKCSVSKWDLFNWACRNGLATIPTLRRKELTTISKNWNAVVIKPAMPVYGKKNVFLVKEAGQIKLAMSKACEESLDGYAIAQLFVEGEDISLVTLNRNGKILWSGFYQEIVSFQDGVVSGEGVATLRPNFYSQAQEEMKATAKLLIKQSGSSGFVFFSFRYVDSAKPMLYEVNPGLCGDELADKLLPAMWPRADFFDLEVAAMTGQELALPQGLPLSVKVFNGMCR